MVINYDDISNKTQEELSETFLKMSICREFVLPIYLNGGSNSQYNIPAMISTSSNNIIEIRSMLISPIEGSASDGRTLFLRIIRLTKNQDNTITLYKNSGTKNI